MPGLPNAQSFVEIAMGLVRRLRGPGGAGQTFRGFSWLMADKLTSMAAALFVSIPIARHLGPADYGLLAFTLSFVAIVMPLSAAGLENIVTRELVERKDDQGVTMGTVLFLRKLIGAIVFLVFGLYCFFGPFPDDRVRIYAAILTGCAIAGNASIFQNWFIANHKAKYFAIFNTGRTVLFSAIRLQQVVMGAPLEHFIYISAIELGISGLNAWAAYLCARSEPLKLQVSKSLAWLLLKRSWPLAASSVAASIYLKLDVVLLVTLSSSSEAGIYSAAARISEIWYFLPTLLMTAMFPTFLDIRRRSESEYSAFLQNTLDTLAAVGTLLAIFVAISSPLIVRVLYGQDFARASAVLSIHIWAGVFIFMRAVLSKWMIAEDLYMFSLFTHGSGAVLNVILNFVLIPKYGAIGAALSTLVAYSSSSYICLLPFARTRPMFHKMTLALLWPRRLPYLLSRRSR
jgi:PST family polysaccharide transporter